MNLAGRLLFRPGRPLPTIESTRPFGLTQSLRGQPPAVAPRWLAAVFTLCGSAHHLAATLATAAALGGRADVSPADRIDLGRATLAEHLRRLWLDWPRLLQGAPAEARDMATLARLLPLLREAGGPHLDAASADSLAQAVFASPVDGLGAWLRAWDRRDDAVLQAWATHAATLPARILSSVWDEAGRLATDALPPLPQRLDDEDLSTLWALLMAPPSQTPFQSHPMWGGTARETGPWTRGAADRSRHARDRLLGRLAEVAHLLRELSGSGTGTGLPPTLDAGAFGPAPGQGIAWCQMARGLLVHAVALDSPAETARIAHYQVLAPTEWNFHPSGAAAMALSSMGPQALENPDRACGIVAAAFDPCVEFDIEQRHSQEIAHA